jgi:thiosulfate reductase cytochrome b subunit
MRVVSRGKKARSNKMTERVYLFKGFERFWHWSQAALIIFLLVSGFEIHGTYRLFGFERR